MLVAPFLRDKKFWLASLGGIAFLIAAFAVHHSPERLAVQATAWILGIAGVLAYIESQLRNAPVSIHIACKRCGGPIKPPDSPHQVGPVMRYHREFECKPDGDCDA